MGLMSSGRTLFWLTAVLAALSAVAFMTLNVQTDWGFILEYRGPRLLSMLLVAVAIGIATVIFQTITHNRILTPSLMGFDVLYVLLQTLILWLLGSGQLAEWPLFARFGIEIVLMVVLASAAFKWLFSDTVRSLHLLILLGMLAGLLFRELSDLLLRVLDPTEFSIQQGRSFASFSRIKVQLLGGAAAVIALALILLWPVRRNLDVLSLGRDVAINLGVNYQAVVTRLMLVIIMLVSASVALVGPTLFFGLLVANLAYWLTGSHQHRWTLPASVLAGVVCLVGGQVVFEHLLQSPIPLALVVEFIGGLLFVILLMRGVKS